MDYLKQLSKSDQHWYDLIQQCRTSRMSDHQWLEANSIKSGTFYYHVKQLRKKACDIPENTCISISRSHVQEVVPLVVEDAMPMTVPEPKQTIVSVTDMQTPGTDNAVSVRLNIQGISVEISNNATQETIKNTLSALRFVC